MSDTRETGLVESREQAVREELSRLLESAAFRNSKRCREFLEYIVDHTISGPTGTLKERSIGVELFQLPPNFDTGQHTIVRVTANEVRKKLAQYYLAANGSFHAVKIDLPPGSYSAEFTWGQVEVEPELPAEALPAPDIIGPAEPASPAAAHGSRNALLVYAAAVMVAAVLAVWLWPAAKRVRSDAKGTGSTGGIPLLSANAGNLRVMVGATESYVDRSGRAWGPDRFFSGGTILARSSERIFRTLDPDLYRRMRQGDFRYDIPLAPGSYELHLHFAETGLADFISAESSGEGQRLFRVTANGKSLLDFFDVVADANGSNTADERVFRNISPADDGVLHLSFASMRGTAMLNGIELLPVSAGTVRPIRIRAGWTTSWQDSAGQEWQGDSYFLGGNALVRTTNPARNSGSGSDGALYASERWGHFSYALPAAEGRYKVTLKFCEGHYGRGNTGVGGAGSRVFDVYCNGVALLRGFDIFKQAGGEGKPIDRAFSGIRPNAQGKIELSFVPISGMACVNGIEVVEDGK